MKTPFAVLFALSLLPACGPADDASDDTAQSATDSLAAMAPSHDRIVRLRADARRDLRRAATLPFAAPGAGAGGPFGADAQACLDHCGGAPWCDALCGPAEVDPADGFAQAQRPPADCPACGRETGFLPSPPTVEARREGQFVAVDWTAVAGAEEYELVVLRQKRGFEDYERFGDQTTSETEARISMLPAGFVYVFAVTPFIDGGLAVELTGFSTPQSL
jgi:hypothetical protein